MDLSASNIPLIPPTTAVLQKFCKQAIFIEQVSVPCLETGGAALEFPMLSVVLSTGEMVETVWFCVFVAPLKRPRQHGGGAGSDSCIKG